LGVEGFKMNIKRVITRIRIRQ